MAHQPTPHVIRDLRTREEHESLVLFADRELQPMPGWLHTYAAKWRRMAAQAQRLPATSAFRQRLERIAEKVTAAANRSENLYALAVASESRTFGRLKNPRPDEASADARRGRRA